MAFSFAAALWCSASGLRSRLVSGGRDREGRTFAGVAGGSGLALLHRGKSGGCERFA